MTRRMRIALVAALGIAAFSASAIVGWQSHQSGQRTAGAAWKAKFPSVGAMSRGVDVIALAEAISTAPGRVAQSADGSDTLPFEVTEFRVVNGVKGVADGASISVERAGGNDETGARIYIDAGGDFEAGRTYLLFLNN